ncbi:MAG: c-type cytochrome [Caldimonas sp.]
MPRPARTGRPVALRSTGAVVVAYAALVACSARAEPRFTAEDVDRGRAQFERTCAQCHGRNMVNSGTTSYDLRRFPVDDSERFFASVTNGKGNMPSFREAITREQIQMLWAYVGSRGGKEP